CKECNNRKKNMLMNEWEEQLSSESQPADP
ncbi:uncharacterized protein METZ01_LOCUS405454, partial [marine metagenome]